jgi:hypothetical protein
MGENMNCCCEKGLELKIKQGESIGFAFTLSEEGNPVDLTNSQMIMQVRENVEDTGEYLINKTITTESDVDTVGVIISPLEGKFMFKVNASDISSMSTTKPYFVAIYHVDGEIKNCISANNHQVAKFIVLNP